MWINSTIEPPCSTIGSDNTTEFYDVLYKIKFVVDNNLEITDISNKTNENPVIINAMLFIFAGQKLY